MINNKANITSISFSFMKFSVYRLVKRQKKRTLRVLLNDCDMELFEILIKD